MRRAIPVCLLLAGVMAAALPACAPAEETSTTSLPPLTTAQGTTQPTTTPPATVTTTTPPDTRRVGVQIGDVAPDFSLPGLDGAQLSLASLRGRPVLLNFWATW